jgi:hypothetical protein
MSKFILYVLYCTTDKEKLNITPFVINFISKETSLLPIMKYLINLCNPLKNIELIKEMCLLFFLWRTHRKRIFTCATTANEERQLLFRLHSLCAVTEWRISTVHHGVKSDSRRQQFYKIYNKCALLKMIKQASVT